MGSGSRWPSTFRSTVSSSRYLPCGCISLLQPKFVPNPGVAAYKPPPGTVISYNVPGRFLAQYGQPPQLADLPPTPEANGRQVDPSKRWSRRPSRNESSMQRSPSDRRLLLRRASAAIPGALMQHRTRRTRVIVRSSAWSADLERTVAKGCRRHDRLAPRAAL
jgi:hypothetical protein